MTLFEVPYIWVRPVEMCLKRIRRVEGETLLDKARAEGRGLLLLVPHLGNWELFSYWYGFTHGRMTALYQPPKLRGLEVFVRKARNRSGNDLVPVSKQGLMQLFRTLKRGGVVGILPDQVPASGHYAPFFGIATLSDVLASRLIRRTNPAILFGVAKRNEAGTFDMVILPANEALGLEDLDSSVAALNLSVESCIALAPEQYQWEYKRFRRRPPGFPRVYPPRRRTQSRHHVFL